MKFTTATAIGLGLLCAGAAAPALADDMLGSGLTMYFQEGGNPGTGSVLARTNGARDAAKALGIKLTEQYSGWQPEVMLNQFKEAVAARPTCIEIMGHPGDAFTPLVDDAESQGIIVTSGNAPLTKLMDKYQSKGFGYAGSIVYEGGVVTAKSMIEFGGLKKGDKALEYGLFGQGERSQSDQGLYDTLVKAGLDVDKVPIAPEADHDATLAVPTLVAYIQAHPDLKAIGTQHGEITGIMPQALQKAGKKPGEITFGGIDLAPATVDGLKSGYISVTFDQELYYQGFLPVQQCVLSKKYGLAGVFTNTGVSTVTAKTIGALEPLIKAGYR